MLSQAACEQCRDYGRYLKVHSSGSVRRDDFDSPLGNTCEHADRHSWPRPSAGGERLSRAAPSQHVHTMVGAGVDLIKPRARDEKNNTWGPLLTERWVTWHLSPDATSLFRHHALTLG